MMVFGYSFEKNALPFLIIHTHLLEYYTAEQTDSLHVSGHSWLKVSHCGYCYVSTTQS